MLKNFALWWITNILSLSPRSIRNLVYDPSDGIILEIDNENLVTSYVRRNGRQRPVALDAVSRLAKWRTVLLRPPAGTVLEKSCAVPPAPRRLLDQALRHKLPLITPFRAEELYWTWDRDPNRLNKSAMNIHLIMVPKIALTPVLGMLAKVGIQPDFIEAGSSRSPHLLSIDHEQKARSIRYQLVHGLAWANLSIFLIALLLPVVLQAIILHTTNLAIASLQPTIAQIDELHQSATDNGGKILATVKDRRDKLIHIIAVVTKTLPDSAFLTDFSLLNNQITLNGHAASAPFLITALSENPAFVAVAFAAPVTRVDGTTLDVFSIRAEIAP